jgi:hypothetical protein
MNQISNLKKVCLLLGLLMPLSLSASGCATAKPKMQVEVTITVHRQAAQPSEEAESSDTEGSQSDDAEPAAE